MSSDVTWADKWNAFGAAAVTLLIFIMLIGAMAITALKGDQQTFASLVETAKALGLLAAGYWLGSSKSSKDKDETIAATLTAQGNKP